MVFGIIIVSNALLLRERRFFVLWKEMGKISNEERKNLIGEYLSGKSITDSIAVLSAIFMQRNGFDCKCSLI